MYVSIVLYINTFVCTYPLLEQIVRINLNQSRWMRNRDDGGRENRLGDGIDDDNVVCFHIILYPGGGGVDGGGVDDDDRSRPPAPFSFIGNRIVSYRRLCD